MFFGKITGTPLIIQMLIERYWMSDHVHRIKILGHTSYLDAQVNRVCGLQEKSHVQSTLMTQQLQQSCRSQVLVLTYKVVAQGIRIHYVWATLIESYTRFHTLSLLEKTTVRVLHLSCRNE